METGESRGVYYLMRELVMKLHYDDDDPLSSRTEECDDSNLLDGDGCTRKCQKEPGFNCNGEFSSHQCSQEDSSSGDRCV